MSANGSVVTRKSCGTVLFHVGAKWLGAVISCLAKSSGNFCALIFCHFSTINRWKCFTTTDQQVVLSGEPIYSRSKRMIWRLVRCWWQWGISGAVGLFTLCTSRSKLVHLEVCILNPDIPVLQSRFKEFFFSPKSKHLPNLDLSGLSFYFASYPTTQLPRQFWYLSRLHPPINYARQMELKQKQSALLSTAQKVSQVWDHWFVKEKKKKKGLTFFVRC